jgi:hypothetical protein
MSALRQGLSYVRKNPFAVLQAAREAARMRLTIPLDLVRWGLGKIQSKSVGEFSVASVPPGVKLGLVAHVMGNSLRVGAVVTVDQLELGPGILRATLRVNGLTVEPQGIVAGPIQALLSSGAIDLSKPGNLLGFLPKKPALIEEAHEDRFVLDLLKVGALRDNATLRRVLTLLGPVLAIRDVQTHDDALLIGLRVHPSGIPLLLAALRS